MGTDVKYVNGTISDLGHQINNHISVVCKSGLRQNCIIQDNDSNSNKLSLCLLCEHDIVIFSDTQTFFLIFYYLQIS